MYTVELNEINVEEYLPYLGEEVAENVGRVFFRGLVLREDEVDRPLGWMIWELKNLEAGEHVRSCIRYFEADDAEESEVLFSHCKEMISADNVEESSVIIPATGKAQQRRQFLNAQGFDMMPYL